MKQRAFDSKQQQKPAAESQPAPTVPQTEPTKTNVTGRQLILQPVVPVRDG